MIFARTRNVLLRQYSARNARFLAPRSDRQFQARRFGIWDEFKKDKSFQEMSEEMAKTRENLEKKAQELRESEAWNKSSEFAESSVEKGSSWGGKIMSSMRKISIKRSTGEHEETVERTSSYSRFEGRFGRLGGAARKVGERTKEATRKVGETTRQVRDQTRSKLKFKTPEFKKPEFKTPEINTEDKKRIIRETFSDTKSFVSGVFRERVVQSGSSEQASEASAVSGPKVLLVEGCVGGAKVCNGFFKPDSTVNDRPVYRGPKLESGEDVVLWFQESENRWVFTSSGLLNT